MGAGSPVPGLNRRGFLTASAAVVAGLGAAGCTAPSAAAGSAAPGNPGRSGGSLTEAVLAAFRTSRLVGDRGQRVGGEAPGPDASDSPGGG